MIRSVLIVLRDKGAVVIPKEWDGEYVLGEINRWLASNYFETSRLIEHSSFALEGIVGAKVRAIVLEKVPS